MREVRVLRVSLGRQLVLFSLPRLPAVLEVCDVSIIMSGEGRGRGVKCSDGASPEWRCDTWFLSIFGLSHKTVVSGFSSRVHKGRSAEHGEAVSSRRSEVSEC